MCYQHLIDSNAKLYEYYGDCADDTYQGGDPKYETPWTPVSMFMLDSQNWSNNSGRTFSEEVGINYGYYDVVYDQVIYQTGSSLSSGVRLGDRHIPQFIDMNGDGLPDVVFSGQAEYGIQTPSHPSTLITGDIPFIMMNNGRGFDLHTACINRQPAYPLLEHFNIPSNQLPRCF